jgi:DNA-binding transcriptional regulator YiaG
MSKQTCAVLIFRKALEPSAFRVLLNRAGLTQAALARLLDRSVTTVNAWAVGRAPVPVEIALLLALIAATPDWRVRSSIELACQAEGGGDLAEVRP